MLVERCRYAVDSWGVGELIVSDGVIVAHDLEVPVRAIPDHAARDMEIQTESSLVTEVVERVRTHLGGTSTDYDDLRLDLSWCTDFQAELARTLRSVPWGEVVSYGELAALAGRPGAARAVGSFCAQNRHWLMLPCHRVVSSDGIGSYGAPGVELKRRLLALEGIDL